MPKRQPDHLCPKFRSGHSAVCLFAALCAWAFCVAPSAACSVPVFRYALERWPADRYRAVVFHDGPLSPADAGLLQRLAKPTSGSAALNMVIRSIDIAADAASEIPASLAELWDAEKKAAATLPWLVVAYPPGQTALQVVWSGPLSAENIATVMDSPARSAVREGILTGESAVWVFLESGDPDMDAAAREQIEASLAYACEAIELPEIAVEDFSVLSGHEETRMPLRLSFRHVSVRPDDPAETFFREMLIRSEPDLATEYAGQPMVFPVYGRGRALYALVGAGITSRNILLASVYITGPCSCEVKAQNPGVDLLIAADWAGNLGPSAIPDAGAHFMQHLARGSAESPPRAFAADVTTASALTTTATATAIPGRTVPGRVFVATLAIVVLVVLLAGAALLVLRRSDS